MLLRSSATKYFAIINYFAIILLAMALYLGYDKLIVETTTTTTREIINAAIGVIFVIVTTMYMLKTQSEVEQKRELNTKIFEKKLALYEGALKIWREIGFIDDEITQKQFSECVEIELKLAMIAPSDILECSVKIFTAISECYNHPIKKCLDNKEQIKLVQDLGVFATLIRRELDLPETKMNDHLSDSFNYAVTHVKMGKNYDKIEFQGTEYGKGRSVLAVITHAVTDKEIKSLKTLQEHFPAEWLNNGKKRKNVNLVELEGTVLSNQNEKNHFKETITLQNGDVIVVYSQWGEGNLPFFVDKVLEKYGYKMKRITQPA
jgi:hypothetical protein